MSNVTPSLQALQASSGRPTRIGTAFIIATLAPLVFVAVHAIGRSWIPSGDEALLLLRTHDTFTADNSFLGPYSRYGWSHPGPLLFWLYAIPYRITGSSSWSLLSTAALASAVSAAGVLRIAWKHGGHGLLAFMSLGIATMTVSLGAAVIQRPWNPYITLLPFAFFVMSTWAVRVAPASLPLNVLVGSFLVQTHVGFGLMVAGLWAFVAWNSYKADVSRRTLIASGAVFVICWAPVVVDQLSGSGNLFEIIAFFAGSDKEVVGLVDALGIVARELGGFAPWMGGAEPSAADGGIAGAPLWTLIPPLVVFAAAARVATKRKDRPAATLLLVVLLTAITGIVSLSRITDGASFYLVRYWWIISMLWWVASLSTLATAIRNDHFERKLPMVMIAMVGVMVGSSFADTAHTNVPTPRLQAALQTIVGPVVADLSDQRLVFVDERGPTGGWVADAVITQLEIDGIETGISEERSFKLPDNVVDPADATAHIVVATGDVAVDEANTTPGARVLALYEPDSGLEPDRLPDGEGPDPEVTAVIRLR